MLSTSKEKKVKELILNHLSTVNQCVLKARDCIGVFMDGDIDTAESLRLSVDRLEDEADNIRRSIISSLGEGAFLPILRGDIHSLVSLVDDIAGLAEDLTDMALGERPHIPDELIPGIQEIAEKTAGQCQQLCDINVEFLSKARLRSERIAKQIHAVMTAEHNIDEIEWRLTRALFDSNLPLADKQHAKQFITRLTLISNKIEDASDQVSELTIKMQV
jgi:predicted phosphate transport protein (TIGR00153 family)